VFVDFYHLASSPLERVLPRICERLLEEGQRLLVVADMPLLERLDEQLWAYASDAFLPHGQAAGGAGETQPILLSESVDPVNGAGNIALADGLWREEALTFERAFYFFDSGRLDDARTAWRALKGKAGPGLRYWKQDERGRWVQGP
jgi:DNA polymerase-3 subunit chi